MADDYRVHPLRAQPGEIPRAGQIADYIAENGDLYTAMLTWVGPVIDGHPGKLQCGAMRIQNGAKDAAAETLVSNPIAVLRDGWSYDVATSRIRWCPCAPPFPDKCP
jgi:hypothetical protein